MASNPESAPQWYQISVIDRGWIPTFSMLSWPGIRKIWPELSWKFDVAPAARSIPEMGDNITQLETVFHAVLINVSQNDYFKWHRMKINWQHLDVIPIPCISIFHVSTKIWITLYKHPFLNTYNSGTNPSMDATWLLEWWSMHTSGQLPEFFFQKGSQLKAGHHTHFGPLGWSHSFDVIKLNVTSEGWNDYTMLIANGYVLIWNIRK